VFSLAEGITPPACCEKTAKLAAEILQKILSAQVDVHGPTQSAVAWAIFAHGPPQFAIHPLLFQARPDQVDLLATQESEKTARFELAL
jgi:hypothetical protein